MPALDYVSIPGKIGLSYSKLKLLRQCPRKFELQELEGFGDTFSSVDTDFGHVVAAGIQSLFATEGNLPLSLTFALSHWNQGIDDEKPRDNKSLWTAIYSIEYFYNTHYQELISLGYRYWEPGIETFFLVHLSDRFFYQGHIDLILLNPKGELEIIEIKTTSYATTEYHWTNSDQTLGYSTALPFIADKYNLPYSDTLTYIIQDTRKIFDPEYNNGFIFLPLTKTNTDRIQWLQSILVRTLELDLYLEHKLFPKEGSSCYSFFRPCKFFGTCNLSTSSIESAMFRHQQYIAKPIEEVTCVVELDKLAEFMYAA